MSSTKVKCKDGVVVEANFDLLRKQSEMINDMLDSCNTESPNEELSMSVVHSEALKKIIAYCEHHKNDPPINEDNSSRNMPISEWDKQFLQIDYELLFELIIASNYLNLGKLLNMACDHLAGLISNKTPDQIRTMFKIENDFESNELAALQRQYQWARRS